jgi:glycosyltransferase involved in cell wall biosynthesis
MKTPLSICMVSDDFLPAMTGVGMHLQLIAPALVRRGHQVCVMTSRRQGEPEMEHWKGVTVHRVRTVKVYGFYQALPSAATVHSILHRSQATLVHHHYTGFMMGTVSGVAETLGLRQLSTYHFGPEVLTQPLPMRPFRALIAWLMVRYCNRFDQIIVPSQKLVRQLALQGVHVPVRYISNPVALGAVEGVVAAERTTGFTVLYAGRLAPEKNLGYLIHAFAALRQRLPDAVLWLAGQGPEGPALHRLCARMGLSESVKFLGFLDHPSLSQYYAACDVFVLPSLQEAQPLVAMEAMWFARPVIVTSAIVSADELVEEGVNGHIVDPRSVADLSSRLLLLASDAPRRAEMGQAGRRRAAAFQPEVVLDALEEAYVHVMQSAHGQ